jgi:alpha-beta hydrolase superfamily lysophospholipase
VIALSGVAWVLPRLRTVALDPAGVSRDPAVVQRYRDDPLVFHGRISLALLAGMGRAAGDCVRLLPSLHIPYLALHGSADPLCSPAAAEIIRAQVASPDKAVKVYEGLYHEIHNEPEQGDVFNDITAWLDRHLPGR